MTLHTSPLDLGKETVLPLAHLTVVATAEEIDRLRAKAGESWADEVNLVAMPLTDRVPDEIVDSAKVVIMHVDASEPFSMRRVEQVRQRRPELPQIVALSNADIALVRTLLRQGVADVVSLPLDPDEMLQAAISSLEGSESVVSADDTLAPLVGVVRSLGGSGATTLLTHLASCFADSEGGTGKGACIIDLDIQFGTVTDIMGLTPRRTLSDLLDAGDRLDGQFLRSVASVHNSGLFVIAAPEEILPMESVETDQLLKVIEVACREFDYVFLDLPSDWSNWSLSVMLQADSLLMLVEQSVPSLKQAVRRLDLLRSIGVPRSKVSVVVNRVEKRLFGSISLQDIAETLKHDVMVGLRADWQSISTARDQGVLVNEVKPKSPYYADVVKLSGMLEHRLSSRGASK